MDGFLAQGANGQFSKPTLLITLITFLHQLVREPHGPSITHSVDFSEVRIEQ
jgi:hypothetical protein